jgi:hypothetical protein
VFGDKISPPWTTVFHLNYILLVISTSSSTCSGVHLSNKYSITSENVFLAIVHFCIVLRQGPHTSLAEGHSHNTWRTVSLSVLQNKQKGSKSIPYLCKLSFVGRILWQALHPNILIGFVTFIPQILFHKAYKADW